jgi:hypothetical protein
VRCGARELATGAKASGQEQVNALVWPTETVADQTGIVAYPTRMRKASTEVTHHDRNFKEQNRSSDVKNISENSIEVKKN